MARSTIGGELKRMNQLEEDEQLQRDSRKRTSEGNERELKKITK